MKTNFLTISVASLLLCACGTNTPSKSVASSDSSVANSASTGVETNPPNSPYKPAFEGQTRIKALHSQTAYEGKLLSKDLTKPWAIISLPDGRLLITQKEGTMRIASTDGKLSDPIKGIPEVNSDGQGGLLGVALDPAFAKNRMIYWTFSEKTPTGNLTAVAKGKLSADEKTIENSKVIYEATPAHKSDLHYGGRILFDKTGNIVFSTGERSDKETRPLAQSLQTSLGKIIRITADGKPAPGNPFFDSDKPARPELYSNGHRNVQSLSFHPVTGDLWEAEFGPKGGDELNRIQPGKNYGWPTITYGMEYSGEKVGEGITQKEGLEQPNYYWDPVLSPSGMTFYTGSEIPEWKNNLFISGLSSNHIARLVIENNKVVGEERILADEGQRFRDVTQGKDGALYAVTDEGRLYRIGKK